MKTRTIGLLVTAGIVVVCGLIVAGIGIGASNREVALRNKGEALQQESKVVYDNTWKVISQVAQVAEKHKQAFSDIYEKVMDKRYQDQNLLLKFITEANPNFDKGLYPQVIDAIQGERAKFTRTQAQLIDIQREHKTLLQTWPASMFVGNRKPLDIQLVTSDKTEKTFASGRENDVEVFK